MNSKFSKENARVERKAFPVELPIKEEEELNTFERFLQLEENRASVVSIYNFTANSFLNFTN